VTVAGFGVVLMSGCAMVFPDPDVAPVTLPAGETVITQEKVVPGTLPVKAMPVIPLLQIVCDAGVAITSGVGWTVTTMVTGGPTQPAAFVSITWSVQVPAFVQRMLTELPVPVMVPFPPEMGMIDQA
jgi:hypothetical protein